MPQDRSLPASKPFQIPCRSPEPKITHPPASAIATPGSQYYNRPGDVLVIMAFGVREVSTDDR